MRIHFPIDRSFVASVFSLLGFISLQCSAQERVAGQPEYVRSPLWPKGSIAGRVETEGDPAVPTMDVHLPDPAKATGSAVVVLPGGGYGGVSMDFEGVHSAQFLTDKGIVAFVVRYRHAPRFHYPLPLEDAQRAVRLVKSRAAEFRVDPNRIGLMGFSAGGHLASMVITQIDVGDPAAVDPFEKVSARPDFAILVYPVINPHFPALRSSHELYQRPSPQKQIPSNKTFINTNRNLYKPIGFEGIYSLVNGKPFAFIDEPGQFSVTTSKGSTYQIRSTQAPVVLEMKEPWSAKFGRYGPDEAAPFLSTTNWTQHEDKRIKYFSGTAQYTTSFQFKKVYLNQLIELDLGTVHDLAEISINGKYIATLWKPPFHMDVTTFLLDGTTHFKST